MGAKARQKSFPPHFILNPVAGGRRTERSQTLLLELLERHFPNGFTLDVTTQQGQAAEMTRQALSNGAELVVAIGGDGTAHECVNGFFHNGKPIRKSSRLGFVGSGTAGDVLRNLDLPDSIESQFRYLGSKSRLVDVGRVTYTDAAGGRIERLFLNECQAGIAAVVVRRVTPVLKRLGGRAAFAIGSTMTVLTYRPRRMSVEFDSKEHLEGEFLGVVVANGRYAGGGMDLAPRSSVSDGWFDVVLIKDQAVPVRLFNFPRIYSGSHIDLPWILYRKARRIRISSTRTVELEADGELLGRLPCEIEILPKVLPVASDPVRIPQKKQSILP